MALAKRRESLPGRFGVEKQMGGGAVRTQQRIDCAPTVKGTRYNMQHQTSRVLQYCVCVNIAVGRHWRNTSDAHALKNSHSYPLMVHTRTRTRVPGTRVSTCVSTCLSCACVRVPQVLLG